MLTEEIKKQKFESDCKLIVEKILGAMDELPKAIIMCGGYGRWEGAWYEDKNGNPKPYNDYDLAVITNKPFSREKYIALRKELANEIGINWIDIDCYNPAQLSHLRTTIHNVDLFEASTLLWGNKDWKAGRVMNAKKIGKSDIIRLYKTRMWALLGSLTEEEIDLSIDEARLFKNQMAKAVLAGCDMRLVANHRYTTSYRERAKITCTEYLNNPSDIRLCEWAINEKLSPSSKEMLKREVKELYDIVYKYFIDSFQYAMGKQAEDYLDPDRTLLHLCTHTKYLPLIVYGFMRGNKKIKKGYDVMRAQNYVFRAYSTSGKYNLKYLAKASSILMHYNYIDAPVQDWRKLCLIVANARNNV